MSSVAEKQDSLEDILAHLIEAAMKAGADAADAMASSSRALSASVRLGALEDIERAESAACGLRVFIGKQQATLSSADSSRAAREALVERAIAMAGVAPADPHAGLAEAGRLARGHDPASLDLADEDDLDEARLKALALEAEDSARAIQGVTNSGGAGASSSRYRLALMTSHGFSGSYQGTSFSVSASVLAGAGTAMERDYAFSTARHIEDLERADAIGREAGERATGRIGAGRLPTGRMPVLFEPRVANSLLGHFAQAINGAAIARGTSFLGDRLGEPVFAPGIMIYDEPTRRRGLRSRPFDAEGVKAEALTLIEDGVLKSWLLDSATARRLGLQTTGSAARGLGSAPTPGSSNLWLAPGTASPDELIADIKHGFYVTELIGMGVNPVTGDYSRGASGFAIENGAIAGPVSEITIAGNLMEMFRTLVAASDLIFRHAVNAPTLLAPQMMVAGA